MTGLMGRLRGMDWLQRAALVALILADIAIAVPFFGTRWNQAFDLSILLVMPGILLMLAARRFGARRSAYRGEFSHAGMVALILFMVWGQPWWPVTRPHDAHDFQLFVFPFLVLVNMTSIILGEGAEDTVLPREEPKPA